MAKAKKLTPRKVKFCHEYVVDRNAYQAAMRAGFAEKTAQKQSFALLKEPAVAALIEELSAKQMKRIEVTADMVIARLASIGFASVGDYAAWDDQSCTLNPKESLSTEQLAAIQEIKNDFDPKLGMGSTKVRLKDSVRALELLGKYFKLFTDKVEHTGTLTLEQLVAASKK
jgi:phage terminase small subunit